MAQALIVEPDRMAAQMLGCVLAETGLAIQIVGTARAALDAARAQDIHVITLEAELPDRDGVDLALELRGRRYRGPLVFITARDTLPDLLRGYGAGADDYVAKPYEPAALIARLQALLRRCASSDAQPLGERIRVDDAELAVNELTFRSATTDTVALTPTELRLLECLMRNPEVVIGRETLIERVWGYDYEGDINRVDACVARLRRKIEAEPEQPRYLHTVRGFGYVFRPERARRVAENALPRPASAALLARVPVASS